MQCITCPSQFYQNASIPHIVASLEWNVLHPILDCISIMSVQKSLHIIENYIQMEKNINHNNNCSLQNWGLC